MPKPKILLFDLETSNLNANFGYMISAAWKWLGEKKIYAVSVADAANKGKMNNDKYVAIEMSKAILEADVIVGHYSKKFDIPFLQTRLLFHGLKMLPNVPHVDTWGIARKHLKFNSNRLASLADFLGLPEKTPVKGRIWNEAMGGDPKAIKYIVDHNRQDVVVLERVYNLIRPLLQSHPNLRLLLNDKRKCSTCAEGHVIKRGTSLTRTAIRQRLQCNKCGAWTTEPLEH